jgi:nitrite reductase/ring-hydroxylating ferredoxin subunit
VAGTHGAPGAPAAQSTVGTSEGTAADDAGTSDDADGDPREILEPGGSPGYRQAPRSGKTCAVRRAVLLGLVASGGAILTGCGGDDRGGNGGQAAQGPAVSAPPSPAAEESYEPFPGADDGGGTGDNGSGLVRTADVPVGGAVLVDDYLIAQPQRGVFKAFDATCPHQGVTVDVPIGSNDYFMCPGHNSKFRLADGGRISGPAPRGLKPVAVKVRNGYVVEA